MNATLLVAFTLAAAHGHSHQKFPDPHVIPNSLGVNVHQQEPWFNLDGDQGQQMYDFGFRAARIELAWQDIQLREDGPIHMAAADALVQKVAETGMRPFIILTYNNFKITGGVSPRTPEQIALFDKFVETCVQHNQKYNPVWEIGNEPTHKSTWKPFPNAEDYTRLVVSAAGTIKRVAPDATICAGSFFPVDEEFLQTFVNEGGLSQIDDISVHPYDPHAPESALKFYRHVQQVIKAQGLDHRIGIMCSEWGYADYWKALSDQRAAEYYPRMYLVNLIAGLDLTIMYEWSDHGPEPSPSATRFGLLDYQNQPKPAFTALKDLLQKLNGYRLTRFRANGAQHEYILVFTKGSSTKLVGWIYNQDPEDMPQGEARSFEEPEVSVDFEGQSLSLTSSPKVFGN